MDQASIVRHNQVTFFVATTAMAFLRDAATRVDVWFDTGLELIKES